MANSRAVITRARLISNLAYYELLEAAPWQIGDSVTIAGCTTGTFNTTGTILKAGLINVPPASTDHYSENWPGIVISISNADIPQEIEPAGAYVSASFGVGNTAPSTPPKTGSGQIQD